MLSLQLQCYHFIIHDENTYRGFCDRQAKLEGAGGFAYVERTPS